MCPMALRLMAVVRSLGGVNHSTATLRLPFSKALGLLCRLQGVVERQCPTHRCIMMLKWIAVTILCMMIPPLRCRGSAAMCPDLGQLLTARVF